MVEDEKLSIIKSLFLVTRHGCKSSDSIKSCRMHTVLEPEASHWLHQLRDYFSTSFRVHKLTQSRIRLNNINNTKQTLSVMTPLQSISSGPSTNQSHNLLDTREREDDSTKDCEYYFKSLFYDSCLVSNSVYYLINLDSSS
jgi:hypothetical protein